MNKTYYEILEVNINATPDEIKKAYYKLAKIHHPDVNGDPEVFKTIKTAYETLRDPNKRLKYDIKINRQSKINSNFRNGFKNNSFNFNAFNDYINDIGNRKRKQREDRVKKEIEKLNVIVNEEISFKDLIKEGGADLKIKYETLSKNGNTEKELSFKVDIFNSVYEYETIDNITYVIIKMKGLGNPYVIERTTVFNTIERINGTSDLIVKLKIKEQNISITNGNIIEEVKINLSDVIKMLNDKTSIRSINGKLYKIKLKEGTELSDMGFTIVKKGVLTNDGIGNHIIKIKPVVSKEDLSMKVNK